MILVKIDADEILEQAEKVRDLGIRLSREAEKLWMMSKVGVVKDVRKDDSTADEDVGGAVD
ncbi:MAG: hypothetical protein HFI88_10030 [Lachnospiraceae bacterium]|nr:hypothetical protein [Lachnospiraceae bacterium]